MRKEWYVLQAYSGMENKVKEMIQEKAKMHGIQNYFGKILIPEVEEINYSNKKGDKFFVSPNAEIFVKNGKDVKKNDLIAEEPATLVKHSGEIIESKNYRKIIVETTDKKYSKTFLIPERAGIIPGIRAGKSVKPGTPFTKDFSYECDVDGEIGAVIKVKRLVVKTDDGESDVYVVPLKLFNSKVFKVGTTVNKDERLANGEQYFAKSSGRIDIKEHSMRKEIKIIKTSRVKLFPGYIFIEMIHLKESEKLIQSIPYVSTFLNVGGKPIKLNRKEIRVLLRTSGEEEYKEKKVKIRSDYSVDEHVKIVSGPFEFFTGKIKELNLQKQEVTVSVTMFGRETEVELSLSEIEKILD